MARELREGVVRQGFTTVASDVIRAMPVELLFDYAAVHVIGERAAEADLRIDFAFTDLDETWSVTVRNGVLNARRGASPKTRLTVRGAKAAVVAAVLQPGAVADAVGGGVLELDGDETALDDYAALLDTFDPSFPIGTPERTDFRATTARPARSTGAPGLLGALAAVPGSGALGRVASLGQSVVRHAPAAARRLVPGG
jgi:alkyl sulfatase BDS1-like metallo-beta-lactamase superfamily hydrolase